MLAFVPDFSQCAVAVTHPTTIPMEEIIQASLAVNACREDCARLRAHLLRREAEHQVLQDRLAKLVAGSSTLATAASATTATAASATTATIARGVDHEYMTHLTPALREKVDANLVVIRDRASVSDAAKSVPTRRPYSGTNHAELLREGVIAGRQHDDAEDDAADPAEGTMRRRIVALMDGTPGENYTAGRVAALLGAGNQDSVRTTLLWLASRGHIVRTERGQFSAANKVSGRTTSGVLGKAVGHNIYLAEEGRRVQNESARPVEASFFDSVLKRAEEFVFHLAGADQPDMTVNEAEKLLLTLSTMGDHAMTAKDIENILRVLAASGKQGISHKQVFEAWVNSPRKHEVGPKQAELTRGTDIARTATGSVHVTRDKDGRLTKEVKPM